MLQIQKKSYFIIIYCVSFYFLIFDTFVGLFQLINLIQRGGDLLNTVERQFRIMNLFVDLITLVGMSLFLLFLWRRLFIETSEEEITNNSKSFKIMLVIGGINLLILVILFPFLIDVNLNVSPIGHVYDVVLKVGLILFLMGIVGKVSDKIERQKNEKKM